MKTKVNIYDKFYFFYITAENGLTLSCCTLFDKIFITVETTSFLISFTLWVVTSVLTGLSAGEPYIGMWLIIAFSKENKNIKLFFFKFYQYILLFDKHC